MTEQVRQMQAIIPGLIGKKVEMSQIFLENKVVPVTILEVGPCPVTQVKTREREGYSAVQIGFGHTKPKKLTKPLGGHLKQVRQKPRYLREIKLNENKEDSKGEVGQVLRVSDVFEVGKKVDITGYSKGKGFAGVMKRWGFKGQPETHGHRPRRSPGSIGSQTPGKVFKGKKLPGRKGNVRVTVQGLEIMEMDKKKNLMKVKGAVPGHRNTLLIVKRSKKR